jgi:hypothetical protein
METISSSKDNTLDIPWDLVISKLGMKKGVFLNGGCGMADWRNLNGGIVGGVGIKIWRRNTPDWRNGGMSTLIYF